MLLGIFEFVILFYFGLVVVSSLRNLMVAIIAGRKNLNKKVLGISEISDACVVYCLVVGLLVSWLVSSINAGQVHWLIAVSNMVY